MVANKIILAAALASAVAAVPFAGQHGHQHHQHHKRDIVWETYTEVDVVTVPVVKTVWVEPGETAAPAATQSKPAKQQDNGPPAVYSQPTAAPQSSAPQAHGPPEAASSSPVEAAPAASSPSSTYVAPAPTTTIAPPPYVAPTTSATPAPAPVASSAPAPPANSAPSSGGSGGNGITEGVAKDGTSYTGDLTYYQVGLGACGIYSTESDKIVAVSEDIFDAYNTGNPNDNPLCNKWVTITGVDGSAYPAQIVDRCTGCDIASLDLPEPYFNTITDNADGRCHDITWSFN